MIAMKKIGILKNKDDDELGWFAHALIMLSIVLIELFLRITNLPYDILHMSYFWTGRAMPRISGITGINQTHIGNDVYSCSFDIEKDNLSISNMKLVIPTVRSNLVEDG